MEQFCNTRVVRAVLFLQTSTKHVLRHSLLSPQDCSGGATETMCLKEHRIRPIETTPYATSADFCSVFQKELSDLYLLSCLLTGDQEKAERCFVIGLDDCVKTDHVFREWAQ